MRLFVAVWPPPDVVAVLAALERPDLPTVRWTGPGQWHVTLRFFGEVPDDDAPALSDLSSVGLVPVDLGPVTARLGRAVLAVPVTGLEALATAVGGERDRRGRPFRGHLTLARAKRSGGSIPASLAGSPAAAPWVVDEVTLVRSHLGGGPARYEIVARVPLAEGA